MKSQRILQLGVAAADTPPPRHRFGVRALSGRVPAGGSRHPPGNPCPLGAPRPLGPLGPLGQGPPGPDGYLFAFAARISASTEDMFFLR